MPDIAAMMNSNKEEMLNKVDGLVEEVKKVKSQVKDLTLRADFQEETNVKMNEKPSYTQVTASNNQEQQRNHEHSDLVTVSSDLKELIDAGEK